jgi:hypothetical protein
MAQLTYKPAPGDNDTTVVDGITFVANQPVDVPDEKAALIDKLSHNPWFTAGVVDAPHDPEVDNTSH